MAFSRAALPCAPASLDALTPAMVGIGISLATRGDDSPNIEDTLYFASLHALEKNDMRILSLLTTWFGMHHAWVNADRITKLVACAKSPRLRAFWAALAAWQATDHRYARMRAAYTGPVLDLLETGTDFQIQRHGVDARFESSCLRVPGNLLRDRPADILLPEALAKVHAHYRYRVLIGPSFRADCWGVLESEPDLSAAELARRTYASFATAWGVKRDRGIVMPALIAAG